jgi:hypothetical protein
LKLPLACQLAGDIAAGQLEDREQETGIQPPRQIAQKAAQER